MYKSNFDDYCVWYLQIAAQVINLYRIIKTYRYLMYRTDF